MEKIIIRNCRSHLISGAVITGLASLLANVFVIADWENDNFMLFLLSLITLALFIFFIKELKDRKIEIAISAEGIYLRGNGLLHWSLIDSFSTIEDNEESVSMKLMLHFKDRGVLEFEISSLELMKDDIVDHMLKYKGSFDTYYAGHRIK